MVILLAFFTVFIYQILGSIMICNVLYYFLLLKEIIWRRSISLYKKNVRVNLWLFLFLFWATFSTIVYALDTNGLSFRNIIQYMFTLQYCILIIKLRIDWKLFESYIYRFSILISLIIIGLYFMTGQMRNFANLFTYGRMWGVNYIPGWPNTTPIPLLFGLFIGLKNSKIKVVNILLIIALVLTTSRGALLGVVSILAYFIFKKVTKNKIKVIVIAISTLLFVLLIGRELLDFVYQLIPSLEYRMHLSYDRQDIMRVTISYFKQRPLLGFGGNTIDQIIISCGNISEYGINWRHAHSWVFETILRYGAIGLFLFTGFLIAIFRSLKNQDNKFMFVLILVLGLFQTYLRNFNILFLILYLLSLDYNQKMMNAKEDNNAISN